MLAKRLIARLDIKGPNLIKGMHLEGLRKVGLPGIYAENYYYGGIDELIYMDAVASLYGRNSLLNVVSETAKNIFVPLTVGGGVRDLSDIRDLLNAGADKVAINTAAVKNPSFIRAASETFGSQCIVLQIDAERVGDDGLWEPFTCGGREQTALHAIEWAEEMVEAGVGEILLTSIDQEGTGEGMDLELLKTFSSLPVPVVASGGVGTIEHVREALEYAEGVAMADVLHYNKLTVPDIRESLLKSNINVRVV